MSSIRPLAHEPMNAFVTGVPESSAALRVFAARAEPGSTTCGRSVDRSNVCTAAYSALASRPSEFTGISISPAGWEFRAPTTTGPSERHGWATS